jgi:CxxC motif-containing protein (DUF1111 family)
MKLKNWTVFILLIALVISCRKYNELEDNEIDKRFSGGANTVFDESGGAFAHPFPGLNATDMATHEVGDKHFEVSFVSAPSSILPGLGPVYNNVSCFSCHIADGRGKPALPGQQLISMLFRISVPGEDAHGGPKDAPGFGGQLQSSAIFGKQVEGSVNISYAEETTFFADGNSIQLRRPTYTIENTYIPAPAGIMLSPRIAPPVFGLGLLQAIPEGTILYWADESDVDGDGISGKPNYVWNIAENKTTLGRFGWKAGAPDLLQQTAGAYNQDMGITNKLFPEESSFGQTQYDGLEDEYEVNDSILNAVVFYTRSLSVPARRQVKDIVNLSGEKIFIAAGCEKCHKASVRTEVNVAFPSISAQLIAPYTDLLLHDMGPDLADGRPDFNANGNEWRTAPLWGIGLTQLVNGHSYFLHDGRARNLMEAILWHGGEAQAAKEYVKNLSLSDRTALISFLNSL